MPKPHRCTERCHRCPLVGGELLPFCMGGANGSTCTCPTAFEVERDLRRELDALKKDVTMLLTDYYRRAQAPAGPPNTEQGSDRG